MSASIRMAIAAVTVIALNGLSAPASADDFAPPPWFNPTHPYYTLQGWEFLTDPGVTDNIAPDDAVGLHVGDGGGSPTANFFGMQWGVGDGDGGWFATGPESFMDLYIPNWIDFEPLKWIRVQITYLGDPENPPQISSVFGDDNVEPNTVFGVPMGPPPEVIGLPIEEPNGNNWGIYYDFEMRPNPNFEWISVFVPEGALIDEVIVDTISFPEPASMALLAIGGLAMIARRR